MDDTTQSAPVVVVPSDSVALVVDNAIDSATNDQTAQIEEKVDETRQQLETKLETLTYEQNQVIEGMAAATADELEKREEEKAAQQEQESQQTRDAYTTVKLEDTQWQYVHDSIALQNTCALLSLVLLCAVLGSNLASRFLDRWR